nr:MAG TPA: hypothetical protein [Inoviridae sp.]
MCYNEDATNHYKRLNGQTVQKIGIFYMNRRLPAFVL